MFEKFKEFLSHRAEDNDTFRDVEDDMDMGYDTSSSAVTEQEAAADYSDGYESRYSRSDQQRGTAQRINIHKIPAGKLAIMKPTEIGDILYDVVKRLKDGNVVVLNLNKIDNDNRKRIVDFTAGVVTTLGGALNAAADFTYIATPNGFQIDSEEEAVSDAYAGDFTGEF